MLQKTITLLIADMRLPVLCIRPSLPTHRLDMCNGPSFSYLLFSSSLLRQGAGRQLSQLCQRLAKLAGPYLMRITPHDAANNDGRPWGVTDMSSEARNSPTGQSQTSHKAARGVRVHPLANAHRAQQGKRTCDTLLYVGSEVGIKGGSRRAA